MSAVPITAEPLAFPVPDKPAMLNALSALFDPADVIELRALPRGRKRTDAGYFDGEHREALADAAVRLNRNGAAVYVTLNTIDPQLLGRYHNRIEDWANDTATDANVIRRRWLLVDLDPARPKNTAATDAQVQQAQSRAQDCYQLLKARGWPEPLAGGSGNGWHLLYPLDLPNDAQSTALVKGALAGLAARLDDAVVKIDQSVFNSARITKLYGTVATKGDHTAAAPWRVSRLVSIPERGPVVTREQLQALAPVSTAAGSSTEQRTQGGFDLGSFLARLNIDYKQDHHEGRERYRLAHCPFSESHGWGESAIFQSPDGKLGFLCQHNSCSGKTWRDVRALIDGPRAQGNGHAVDLSGLIGTIDAQPSPKAPEPNLSDEARKLAGALAVIPKSARHDRHPAERVIGWALRHESSGLTEAEGASLCSKWDTRTGAGSIAAFRAADPDYQATSPITVASIYALAKAHGWSGSPEPEPWPEPLPIPSSLLAVAAFDLDLLPDALRPWVADIADRMQCPVDFPAVAAMVGLSSVIGRKACIRPKRHDDWEVVPNLWGVVVGRPGVMKSPALAEALRPLDRLAGLAGDAYKKAIGDYDIKTTLAGMSGKAAEAQAQKLVAQGKTSDAEKVLIRAAAATADAPPALRRYKVTDSSVEALGEILIENPWGTLAYRDELHGLLRSLDKEGQEGARAFYLQGYDGNQGYTFDRIMRGRNLHIPAACIAMLGGIQPGKLQAYIHDAVSGGAGDDGLLQRFGMLVWPDVGGEWRNVDRWPDTAAKTRAFDVFRRLDSMAPGIDAESGEPEPAAYHFDDDAQTTFEEWRAQLEVALRSGDHHLALESHLSKYRKLVPALALVCALADGEAAVGERSLLRALAWSDYLRTHAERAYAAGAMPATEAAAALLAKIRAGQVADGFRPADVYLKGWARLNSPEAVLGAARLLCDLHHVRRVETKPSGSGRPSITYQVNPATMASR